MVDQGTTGGIERRESKKREILRPEGISWETSYNVKEDFGVFPTPWLSSEGASSQAEDCPYLERIAQIIEEDKAFPKKHRHIAKRIYERIREMGYGGKVHPGEGSGEGTFAGEAGGLHAPDPSGGRGAGGFWVCAGQGFWGFAEGGLLRYGTTLLGCLFCDGL